MIADTQHLDLGTSYGIGIDEDTALIITDGGGVEAKAEVIGTNGIFFTDLSQANIIINEYYISQSDLKSDKKCNLAKVTKRLKTMFFVFLPKGH